MTSNTKEVGRYRRNVPYETFQLLHSQKICTGSSAISHFSKDATTAKDSINQQQYDQYLLSRNPINASLNHKEQRLFTGPREHIHQGNSGTDMIQSEIYNNRVPESVWGTRHFTSRGNPGHYTREHVTTAIADASVSVKMPTRQSRPCMNTRSKTL